MARIYRSALNSRITVNAMVQLIYALEKIRVALIAEAEAAAGTTQNSSRTINNIQIVAVPPNGHVIDSNGQLIRQIDGDVLRIESQIDAH